MEICTARNRNEHSLSQNLYGLSKSPEISFKDPFLMTEEIAREIGNPWEAGPPVVQRSGRSADSWLECRDRCPGHKGKGLRCGSACENAQPQTGSIACISALPQPPHTVVFPLMFPLKSPEPVSSHLFLCFFSGKDMTSSFMLVCDESVTCSLTKPTLWSQLQRPTQVQVFVSVFPIFIY